MKRDKSIPIPLFFILLVSPLLTAQEKLDPQVSRKLDWFKEIKFGLLMHWGPYSQWGVVESWSICSEDEPWCRRNLDDYTEYKRRYEQLKTTFNPVRFNPDRWAEAAAEAGMRYVIFTTKHHDGFCMFDTKETDYKITDTDCPFHTNPKADVTKEIFRAFRNRGFGVGVYFSKPDWHSEYYWWPYFATPDRNVNYNPRKYPARWQQFREFTYNQIKELMSGYGAIDILWLDGGWVRPDSTITEEVASWCKSPYEQDISMDSIATVARSLQPGLLIVDRTVHGPYENYRTPEQQVPDKPLPYAWETCMTMATSWSYVPHDRYKPARQLIHLLVDIVAKGGNLLLNIGPGPDGEWHPEAYERLQEIGAWMNINSEAIYGSSPEPPYQEDKIRFTLAENGNVYAIYLAGEKEEHPPADIRITGLSLPDKAQITMLGSRARLNWKKEGESVFVHLPGELVEHPPCRYAWVLKITS